jgi:hypothetical protein
VNAFDETLLGDDQRDEQRDDIVINGSTVLNASMRHQPVQSPGQHPVRVFSHSGAG